MVAVQNFTKNARLLEYRNIWLGDTGATVDMTPNFMGAVCRRQSNAKVKGINDKVAVASKLATLPVVYRDNTGVELFPVQMEEVH